jgi:hypothetical protein
VQALQGQLGSLARKVQQEVREQLESQARPVLKELSEIRDQQVPPAQSACQVQPVRLVHPDRKDRLALREPQVQLALESQGPRVRLDHKEELARLARQGQQAQEQPARLVQQDRRDHLDLRV